MRYGALLAFLVAVAVAASGCISDKSDLQGADDGRSDDTAAADEPDQPEPEPAVQPTSWSWSSGGHTTSDQSGRLQAPSGSASLTVNAGGYGDAKVTVTDAGGKVVFERSYGGSGGASDSTTIDGAPGEWTVEVDVGSWSGGFQINVQGH